MSIREWLAKGFAACVLVASVSLGTPAIADDGASPVVFAAASLNTALDDVNAAWTAEGKRPATLSYAASSALAKKIEPGAPADLFASADPARMNYLTERNLIRADSRVELLGNELALVAPAASNASAEISSGFPPRQLLREGKLAMANVEPVPAGKYGRDALRKLGVWSEVEDQVAQVENARAALLLVSRGEAALGTVYKTDAVSDPGVRIVGTFPADSHEPIVYPSTLTSQSRSEDARAYLAFLKSEKAMALFRQQGFSMLPTSR